MKTIYIKKDIYSYEELNEIAKRNALETYAEHFRTPDIFEEYAKEILNENIPENGLDIQFDFSCCQGSGVNIYGIFNVRKYLEIWENGKKSILLNAFYFLEDMDLNFFTFSQNRRYTYSLKFLDKKEIPFISNNFSESLADDYTGDAEEAKTVFEKFLYDMIDFFESIEDEIYKAGYNFFNNFDDIEEEAREYFTDFGVEFLENGEIY